jgi:signal transduction histidine kinase
MKVVGEGKTREQLERELEELRLQVTEAEEQLRRLTVRLKQTEEELQGLAYVVSHDLRAPLINLKGFTAELRSGWEAILPAIDAALPHLDEEQKRAVVRVAQDNVPEALGFIESATGQMDRFVGAILNLSRLTRCPFQFESIDTEALVRDILQTLEQQIERRRASVIVGALPRVIADRAAMEQIWGHVLRNAILYLDADRLGEVEITAELDRGETVFHVRDNGRGIAEADMEKVFEPLRRAGTQDVPGDGMGLAYARTLIRRHGGRISCASELGVGTTLTFTVSNRLEEGGAHAE